MPHRYKDMFMCQAVFQVLPVLDGWRDGFRISVPRVESRFNRPLGMLRYDLDIIGLCARLSRRPRRVGRHCDRLFDGIGIHNASPVR